MLLVVMPFLLVASCLVEMSGATSSFLLCVVSELTTGFALRLFPVDHRAKPWHRGRLGARAPGERGARD